MQVHRIEVARTARVVASGDPRDAREIWFLLHGHGQLASAMLEACRALEAPQRFLIAPEALSRFYLRSGAGDVGATWMTREERDAEIADYVRYLDRVAEWSERELGCRAAQRVVLGFSQGAATAWRWTALGWARIDRLIAWGSEVPPDLDLVARRARLATTHLQAVRGSRDEFQTTELLARDRARLQAAGLACDVVEFDGGHQLAADVLASVAAGRAQRATRS
jgi:predicted esterase